jgi:hypothetical protein
VVQACRAGLRNVSSRISPFEAGLPLQVFQPGVRPDNQRYFYTFQRLCASLFPSLLSVKYRVPLSLRRRQNDGE